MDSPNKHQKAHRRDRQSKPYSKKFKNSNFEEPEKLDHFTEVSLPGKGRPYTVSIAVPASILDDTCLKDDLRTYLVGQLARSAVIYGVDEIVVFNDHCWKQNERFPERQKEIIDFMKTILEYQECPQYLRKRLCPLSDFLKCAGVLNPAAAPHHLKVDQWCPYREGIVVGRNGKSGSLVDVGLDRKVTVSHKTVPEGSRVTVELPTSARIMDKPIGTLVSPHEPRTKVGLYWGYSVRVANSLAEVFTGTDDTDGYDFLIGTSDRGTPVEKFKMPKFKKLIIVFGGVDGLERSLKKESSLTAERPDELFDAYLNVCARQYARTIRTEEAIPLTLAALEPKLHETNV